MGFETVLDANIGNGLPLPFDSVFHFQSPVHQLNFTWKKDFDFLTFPDVKTSVIKNGNKSQKAEAHYPNVWDMKYWLFTAFVLIALRHLFDRLIFKPFGKYLGVKDKRYRHVQQIPCRLSSATSALDKAYISSKSKNVSKLPHNEILEISRQTSLNTREIERWLRRRRALDNPSPLTKFGEAGWRVICYIGSTSIGITVLWDKPWASGNMDDCWVDYPHQELSNDVWWFLFFGTSHYISLLLTQFFDVRRKDFWEMFVHHVLTIGLLATSFIINATRFGAICLLLHDCADIFIESAKLANYAKMEKLATWLFGSFTIIWVVTRIVIYPWKFLVEGTISSSKFLAPHMLYPLSTMLTIIFGLHLFWTYYIVKMVINVLRSGPSNQKDERSDNESESEISSDESGSSSIDQNQKNDFGIKQNQKRFRNRLYSLPHEPGKSLLAQIERRQKMIMKRISLEIM